MYLFYPLFVTCIRVLQLKPNPNLFVTHTKTHNLVLATANYPNFISQTVVIHDRTLYFVDGSNTYTLGMAAAEVAVKLIPVDLERKIKFFGGKYKPRTVDFFNLNDAETENPRKEEKGVISKSKSVGSPDVFGRANIKKKEVQTHEVKPAELSAPTTGPESPAVPKAATQVIKKEHHAIESDSSVDEYTQPIKNVKVQEADSVYFSLIANQSDCVTYFKDNFIFTPCNKSDIQMFKLMELEDAKSKFLGPRKEKRVDYLDLSNKLDSLIAELSSYKQNRGDVTRPLNIGEYSLKKSGAEIEKTGIGFGEKVIENRSVKEGDDSLNVENEKLVLEKDQAGNYRKRKYEHGNYVENRKYPRLGGINDRLEAIDYIRGGYETDPSERDEAELEQFKTKLELKQTIAADKNKDRIYGQADYNEKILNEDIAEGGILDRTENDKFRNRVAAVNDLEAKAMDSNNAKLDLLDQIGTSNAIDYKRKADKLLYDDIKKLKVKEKITGQPFLKSGIADFDNPLHKIIEPNVVVRDVKTKVEKDNPGTHGESVTSVKNVKFGETITNCDPTKEDCSTILRTKTTPFTNIRTTVTPMINQKKILSRPIKQENKILQTTVTQTNVPKPVNIAKIPKFDSLFGETPKNRTLQETGIKNALKMETEGSKRGEGEEDIDEMFKKKIRDLFEGVNLEELKT